MWLKQRTREELEHWLRRMDIPLLSSMPDGKILWCNSAFELFTGYTSAELDLMTWVEMTEDKTDLAADLQMAKEVALGTRESYSLQKEYRTKHGPPKRVKIHVVRNPFPPDDFVCYFVTVTPMDGDDRFDELQAKLDQLEHKLDFATRYWNWAKKYPYVAVPATLSILAAIFGERVLIYVERVFTFFFRPGP